MTETDCISFDKTGINPLIIDYLAQKPELKKHYTAFPTPEAYLAQASKKLAHYPHRSLICEVLREQMEPLDLSEAQKSHLTKLAQPNTVTVTTGHQLNLMTGPLYFVYKILHAVKVCDTLNKQQDEYHYVPIYWMATEDHDFEEINHFHAFDKKWQWERDAAGAVGHFDLKGLKEVLNQFTEELPQNKFSDQIKEWIKTSYGQQENLAQATRHLVNEMLGEYGVLILDADDARLKKAFVPQIEKDLLEHTASKAAQQNENLTEQYGQQAYVREINFFYLTEKGRHRIEKNDDVYSVIETDLRFSQDEIIQELQTHPERFSPNVILRPLYQETILPNVAYIGGGGEMAYWLQLKTFFTQADTLFPLLVVRNSLLFTTLNEKRKAKNLGWWGESIFQPKNTFLKQWIQQDNQLFEFLNQKEKELHQLFDSLSEISENTHGSFDEMLRAQRQKQLNGFAAMRDRLTQAELKNQADKAARFQTLHQLFFPNGSWQERKINFTQFYAKYGGKFFDETYRAITPFDSQFIVNAMDESIEK